MGIIAGLSEDARWLIAASGPMDDRWTAWVETLKAKRPDSVVHLESAEGIFPFRLPLHAHAGMDRIANAAGAAAEDAQADWLIIDAAVHHRGPASRREVLGGPLPRNRPTAARDVCRNGSLPYPKTGGNKPLEGLAWMSVTTRSSLIAGAVEVCRPN